MTVLDLWSACCKPDVRLQLGIALVGHRQAPLGFAFRTAVYGPNGYTVARYDEAALTVWHGERRVCALLRRAGAREFELYYGASHPLCDVAWVGVGERVRVEALEEEN